MSMNKPRGDEPRANELITASTIRLIDEEGEMLGVMSRDDGIEKARQAGLDLVEVSPNADPPVCKLLDFGKFKYEAQKRANAARKKQKIVHIKEVKLRPTIEEHDYEVKMRHVKKFLEAGDKVKVTLRFRGREMSHHELGLEVLQRVRAEFEDDAKVEHEPKLEGRQMIMILAPR